MYHPPLFRLPVRFHRSCADLVGAVLAAGLIVSIVPAAPATAASTARAPLVLFASQGYDAAVAKAFQEATGIEVKLDTNAAGTLLDEIEANRGRPRWGVLWIDGPTTFARLDRQHLLQRGLEPHVSWNELGKATVPRDRSFVPTGVTLADAELYTSRVVTSPPSSWQQLLEPQWHGSVGMANPEQSGITYAFIAGMMQHLGGRNGVRAGKDYFAELHHNGLVVRTTNSTTLEALSRGRIKIALIPSSAAVGALHTRPTLAVRYLAPVTELPSAIGVDARASKAERAEAHRFLAFVLSRQGQQIMQSASPSGGSIFYPVVAGEQPPAALPALSTVSTQLITPYEWGSREGAILAWFSAHVAG